MSDDGDKTLSLSSDETLAETSDDETVKLNIAIIEIHVSPHLALRTYTRGACAEIADVNFGRCERNIFIFGEPWTVPSILVENREQAQMMKEEFNKLNWEDLAVKCSVIITERIPPAPPGPPLLLRQEAGYYPRGLIP